VHPYSWEAGFKDGVSAERWHTAARLRRSEARAALVAAAVCAAGTNSSGGGDMGSYYARLFFWRAVAAWVDRGCRVAVAGAAVAAAGRYLGAW
jgi:hypothetical protein